MPVLLGRDCNYARRVSVGLLQRVACDCGKKLTVRLRREKPGAIKAPSVAGLMSRLKAVTHKGPCRATWRCYFGCLLVGALAGLTMPCSKFFSLEMVQISSPMSHGFNLYVLVTPQEFV
jgi:hypothetical protein